MSKFMIAVLTGVFVMGVSSVSFAGMFDKAVEATEQANTMAKDAKATADSAEQKAIEAQDASTQESGGLMDQAKGKAKETVNDTQGTVNEKIDSIGK
jgi:hypothetical protein